MQKLKVLSFSVFIISANLLLAGCDTGQLFGPTPTLTPSHTPTPSSTPTPSITPTPTFTLTPTPTIEPPAPLPDSLENVQLTFYDSFDYLEPDTWGAETCQTVSNGELEYACTVGFFSRDYSFHEGEGILIDFKSIRPDVGEYYWGINLSHGKYAEDEWRVFGVSESNNGQTMHITKAQSWSGSNIYFKSDVWYRLALAVDADGRILIQMWERDSGKNVVKYRNTLGADWANLDWYFWVNSDHNPVTLYFDNFYQLQFDKIN